MFYVTLIAGKPSLKFIFKYFTPHFFCFTQGITDLGIRKWSDLYWLLKGRYNKINDHETLQGINIIITAAAYCSRNNMELAQTQKGI